ncbi:protein of unknown function (plasmid) [Vibrio harveyi]|nr:protein of unknown function [Vibrio harveyi]
MPPFRIPDINNLHNCTSIRLNTIQVYTVQLNSQHIQLYICILLTFKKLAQYTLVCIIIVRSEVI